MPELIGLICLVLVVCAVALIWYIINARGDSKNEQIKTLRSENTDLKAKSYALVRAMNEIASNTAGNPCVTAQAALDDFNNYRQLEK